MRLEKIRLGKMMRILDVYEPWTIGTDKGDGWLFYFDGEKLHNGTDGMTLGELLRRDCVDVYEREERKYFDDEEYRKHYHFMELEAGLAFIVVGRENGSI